MKPAAQHHMQAVSDRGDENVRFNPLLELMVEGADSQNTLQIAEGLLYLGQLNVKLQNRAGSIPTRLERSR